MQMPSLMKYFAFVGAALLALLSLANFLLEPSTGTTPVAAAAAKPAAPVVRHEPGASRIERWRNEQAALKAAEQQQTAANASLAAKSTTEPVRPVQAAVQQPAAAPIQAAPAAIQPVSAPAPAATAPLVTDTASLRGEPSQDDRAAQAARLKAERSKAAKAKRARLARERAKAEQNARAQFYNGAQQRTASNQQDQYYYYQRARQQEQRQGYAYAPRQSYGPFGGW